MSRPTTRNKNKRHRPEEEVDKKTEILRRIHSTGIIAQDDVEHLYNILKTVCQGCRVNTKDNPNCLCGLVPPPSGSRKTGLWQKTSEIISSLGPDPSNDLRASDDSPAGLTNLGATCYANSILQYLYMNKAFREGIFSVEPEVLKQQPVLDQLARLFVQLHLSKRAFIDSAPFIKTLELDNGVQQDSHEFLTLLLSLLEQCLSRSKVAKERTIVPDLFRGSMSHVTRCTKCGQDSEASSNLEDFYELELNVKGLKNLEQSLNDYLTVEALNGDNQYFCASCGTRVDATRSIMLRSLPRVLNFQLKRYVFHPQTATKKKITAAFSFPQELDMGHRLSEPFESPLTYDLSAVLVHKGTATNSGHYLAHIKDESSGQWWEFDDEHVQKLGNHPFGEGSSSSSSKLENGPAGNRDSVDQATGVSAVSHVNGNQSQLSDDKSTVEMYSSSDAYMLMYILRQRNSSRQVSNMYSADSTDIKETGGEVISSNVSISPPCYLSEEVKALNASYLDACEKYNLRKENELKTITERRQEVRAVLSEAPVLSLQEPYFWISAEWLRQWADTITPPVLDNSTIQCVHGKVSTSKIGSLKRLSANAWALLYSKYNGGPCLSDKDYCVDCLIHDARATVSAESYRDRRASMKELAEAALGGKGCDGVSYFVSRTWLQQWLRRKNSDYPSEADAGPTASIRCPHGKLMPEQAAGAKRVMIPESLWLFLYENAKSIKPEDHLGCSTFASDAEACVQCYMECTEVACFEDTLRANKLKQRHNHEKLALGKSLPLSPNCKYYLLPSSWVSKWRTYVSASVKNISASVEPELLDGIIESLICPKHFRLLEKPLGLVCKRGIISQKASSTDGLTIITENDWEAFCEEWGGIREKGIVAEIELSNSLERNLVGANQEMLNSEVQVNNASNELESRQPVIKTVPEICEECIGERESCELMEKLNYCNENICVCFVRGKEAPKSILEASRNSFEPDRRTSKRSRKTAFGNSINLKVSGSTSVYRLKMMIWESFGVVKENQIIHKGSSIIDGESTTLADLNIFPGDVLWVTDSEIHEHRDIADELCGQKSEVQQAEEGFRGTLLASATATTSQLV